MPVFHFGNVAPPELARVPVRDAFSPEISNILWWQIVVVIWFAGVLLFLACHMHRHLGFMKLAARWSEVVAYEQTLALLESLKTQIGVSRRSGLKVCGSAESPTLTGFAKLYILLLNADFTL